jgi:NTE family protein
MSTKSTSVSPHTTGLALGGGAVLGAAHVGVLKALREHEVKIDCITGTSIGALVGAFYAFGKSTDEIEAIAAQLSWLDVTSFTLTKYGLLSNKSLGKLINDHLGDCRMESANIPFAVVATDIATGQKVVISEGPVAEAVMASTCLPGIFKPVRWGERFLVDGGIVENVPVATLRDLGANRIIAVDLNARQGSSSPKNILEVMTNSFHFLIKSSTHFDVNHNDLLIEPDLSKFNMVDTRKTKKLIEQGYIDANAAFSAWTAKNNETKKLLP